MKRAFFAFCFLILSAPFLSAGGIGAGGAYFFTQNDDVCTGACLDYAFDTIPFIFTGDVIFENSGVKGALAGLEFCAGNINLFKALNFFYTPELCAGYDFLENKVILENAFYLGLNGFFAPHFQLYTQAGWAPQVLFAADEVSLNLVNFPVHAGLRFWTK